MAPRMKEIGIKINRMVKVKKYSQMAQDLKAYLKMDLKKKDALLGQMGLIMKEK